MTPSSTGVPFSSGSVAESVTSRAWSRRCVWTSGDARRGSGALVHGDGHVHIIRDESGTETELPRKDGEPKVVLADRLQHHLDLLATYHDDDIHNLTAYLATFK